VGSHELRGESVQRGEFRIGWFDHFRRTNREVAVDAEGDEGEDLDALLFNERGGFVDPPRAWADPEGALQERQFLEILEACVERMPNRLGRVFLMREWLELDTEEICRDLGVTSSNVWVMLHRARLRLRECIQVEWLGQSRK
jgi:RNA polymerase sigma-70 factor (ECF subfamily)